MRTYRMTVYKSETYTVQVPNDDTYDYENDPDYLYENYIEGLEADDFGTDEVQIERLDEVQA